MSCKSFIKKPENTMMVFSFFVPLHYQNKVIIKKVMKRNPFSYPAIAESMWQKMLKETTNYKPKTTFFNDLSVAECFGVNAVKDTYKRVIKSWGENIIYMTEFTMCLNHKIWQLYEIDRPMAEVYDELWRKSCEFVETHFSGKDLSYYYEVTD